MCARGYLRVRWQKIPLAREDLDDEAMTRDKTNWKGFCRNVPTIQNLSARAGVTSLHVWKARYTWEANEADLGGKLVLSAQNREERF